MAIQLGAIKPPDHFSHYNSTLPGRQEAVHPDQAAAFDKAVNSPSAHSVENHSSASNHSEHCCCCCCCGGGDRSMSNNSVETEELLHAAKKLTHAIKDAKKEEEYWDAFHQSLNNSIFQKGNRTIENAKKEGERILEEYYLNPPKSNKRNS